MGDVGLFYRALRGFVRAALNVFYRTIEVTGLEHLDAGTPTILACNHPNSIVDPLLLGTFEERQVSFCARDGLFKIPGFGSLLRSVGAIPLRRRSDHGGGSVDNEGAFSACRGVLLAGGVLAIFPEGKTHSRMRIEPLKTGAARIALDAVGAWRALAGDGSSRRALRIVPVGITYLVRHAFLSDVHVAIGPPIDPAAAPSEPDDQSVRAITARVEGALRDLALHIEEEEDERFIAQVTAIVAGIRADEGLDRGGQSPAERTALARRVLDAHRWMKETDPYRTAQLRQRIESYMEERRRLGLGGERAAFQHRGERRRPLSGARWAVFFLLGAPFAAYGLAVSLLPYVILRSALRVFRPSTDRVALFKLLAGLVTFSLCWAAQIAGVAMSAGPLAAVAFGVSLMPAAFFAQRYVTETRLHRLQLRSLDTFLQSHRMARLRAERQALAAELAEIRHRYLAHIGEE
jgi:glycerol-3-phosphate O-acyltransferase/dihydroxyacetone phosphate acyltransferase